MDRDTRELPDGQAVGDPLLLAISIVESTMLIAKV